MRAFLLVVLLALVVGGVLVLRPPSCGAPDTVACPSEELANGLGVTIPRGQACQSAGYLCAGRGGFQVQRWSLSKGRLRVRVPPPPIDDPAERRRLHEAAVAGIMQWEGHPFPIQIDDGRLPRRLWDVELYWVPRAAFGGTKAGVAQVFWREHKGVPDFAVRSISTVTFTADRSGRNVPAESALVSQVAAHEMGHALGILHHSDRTTDVMTPNLVQTSGVSQRDLQTVDALYRLPNGALVPPGG